MASLLKCNQPVHSLKKINAVIVILRLYVPAFPQPLIYYTSSSSITHTRPPFRHKPDLNPHTLLLSNLAPHPLLTALSSFHSQGKKTLAPFHNLHPSRRTDAHLPYKSYTPPAMMLSTTNQASNQATKQDQSQQHSYHRHALR